MSTEIQTLKRNIRALQEKLNIMMNQLHGALNQLDDLEKTVDSLDKAGRQIEFSPLRPSNFDSFHAEETHEQNSSTVPFGRTGGNYGHSSFYNRRNVPVENPYSAQRPQNQHVPSDNLREQQASTPSIDLVAIFNSLANKKGFALNDARKDFLNRYRVRAFNCANFAERVNEPIPPPKFVEVETPASGEYWAVPVKDNLFAVFPNVKSYTANAHSQRAMGEVFRSNFMAGRTYNEIIVDKPAVFEYAGTVWRLIQQGSLQLR